MPETKVVAIAYSHFGDDGEVREHDECYTWETAQTLANEGYKIVAVADDGEYWTKERIQKLCDGELAAAIDCFGEGHMK